MLSELALLQNLGTVINLARDHEAGLLSYRTEIVSDGPILLLHEEDRHEELEGYVGRKMPDLNRVH